MSEFDEEGPEEQEPPPGPEPTIPVLPERIEVDVRGLGGMLREAVERQVHAELHRDGMIRKFVERAVQAGAEEQIRAQLAPIIAAVVADGWELTDEYGRPKGKKVTVRDMVLEFINGKTDNYSSSRTWIRQQLEAAVTAALGKELAAEVKAAREMFKHMLDDGIRTKLAEALRSALGLGPG